MVPATGGGKSDRNKRLDRVSAMGKKGFGLRKGLGGSQTPPSEKGSEEEGGELLKKVRGEGKNSGAKKRVRTHGQIRGGAIAADNA